MNDFFLIHYKRSILSILLLLFIGCKNERSNFLSSVNLEKLKLQKEYSFIFPDSLKVNGFYLNQIKLNEIDTEFIFHNRKKNVIIIFKKEKIITYGKCPKKIDENFLIKVLGDTILSFSYYDNKFNIWNNDFIRFYKLTQLNDSFQYIPLNLNFSDTLLFFYRLICFYNEEQFYNYYNKGFHPLIFIKIKNNILKQNTYVQIIPIKCLFEKNKNKDLPHQSLNLTFKGNNVFIENSFSDNIFSYNLITKQNNIYFVKNNPFFLAPRYYNYDTTNLDPTVLMFNVYNSMNKVHDLVYLDNKKLFFRNIKLSDSLRLILRRDFVFQLMDTNFHIIKNFVLEDSINDYTILPFQNISKILFCYTNYKNNSYEVYIPVFD